MFDIKPIEIGFSNNCIDELTLINLKDWLSGFGMRLKVMRDRSQVQISCHQLFRTKSTNVNL